LRSKTLISGEVPPYAGTGLVAANRRDEAAASADERRLGQTALTEADAWRLVVAVASALGARRSLFVPPRERDHVRGLACCLSTRGGTTARSLITLVYYTAKQCLACLVTPRARPG
jgi:hypothetical protein